MARLLEGMNRAALRIDPRQHVLDDAVLAGGVDTLQDHEDGPFAFRVEAFLELGELLDANLQNLLAVLLVEVDVAGIAWVVVLELEFVTVGDAVTLDDFRWQHAPPLFRVRTSKQRELQRFLDARLVFARVVDLGVHLDRFEEIVGRGTDDGKRFLGAYPLRVEPRLELFWLQWPGHAVVQCRHGAVRSAGEDGPRGDLATLGVLPALVAPGEVYETGLARAQVKRPPFFLRPCPLIEAVGRNEAAPAAHGVAEGRFLKHLLGARID